MARLQHIFVASLALTLLLTLVTLSDIELGPTASRARQTATPPVAAAAVPASVLAHTPCVPGVGANMTDGVLVPCVVGPLDPASKVRGTEGLQVTTYHARSLDRVQRYMMREKHQMATMLDQIEHAVNARGKERPVVVDVGANHGIFSIVAARHGATVIAVEPQSDLAAFIKLSMGRNGFAEDTFVVLHMAVSDARGRVLINISRQVVV